MVQEEGGVGRLGEINNSNYNNVNIRINHHFLAYDVGTFRDNTSTLADC